MSLSDEDLTRIEALAAGTGLVESRDLRLLVKEVREHRKHIGQLQERLAKRRQSFRDLEHRAKTLHGARKAIQFLGKKLRVALGALREIVEANDVDGYVLDAGAARKAASKALEAVDQVGRTSISPSSVGDGPKSDNDRSPTA